MKSRLPVVDHFDTFYLIVMADLNVVVFHLIHNA